jgi:uncharacterized protein (DUF885 family)
VSTAFEVSDRYVDDMVEMVPPWATMLGVPGHDHEWGESFSLQGIEALNQLNLRYRGLLQPHLSDPDSKQRLAARVNLGSIEERIEGYEAGDDFRELRHMASPFHQIGAVFDVMPGETDEQWSAIVSRLETIDKPYRDYRDTLDEGRRRSMTVARRQVESVIDQASQLAGPESGYLALLGRAEASGHREGRLEKAIDHARHSVGEFGDWLHRVYLPDAVEEDGVGEDVYRRAANQLVGMAIDPAEAYAWGWEELHRLIAEMERVGEEILPGAGWAGVRQHLESDPAGLAQSPEALVAYVTEILEQAVDDLAGTHFEVPDVIRPITVKIAPPGGPRAVYYIRPSEDFSRPGGVWYSLGGETLFPLYQHTSTAYHEAFPGHHLQIATAMYHKEDLSRAQRVATWYPGYGEGWGMYAEVLMGELGYLEDPKHYFGMLAKQMYRAARVVVDIGLHTGARVDPSSTISPGEKWGFEQAVEFMRVYGFQTAGDAEAEVLRYLGWPGQAISYKLGEREMLRIREETKQRKGPEFDLKTFHATLLDHGSMRFDTLRATLSEIL